MKGFVLIVGILICFCTPLFAQITKPNIELRQVKTADEEKVRAHCTSAIDGLIFCIKTPTVSVSSNQNIPITINVQNTTAKIAYLVDSPKELFDMQLVDQNQMRVLSRKEELAAQTPVSTEITPEVIAQFEIGSRSFTRIPEGGKISKTYNLADYYDFKKKGKYKLTIRKTEPSQPFRSERKYLLGSININIK